ncbi:MAG: DUF882 domain-containing protein [Nitrosomonas sp.]|nr:DUF882 domain-containing protein [Nitrosomonas sp.]
MPDLIPDITVRRQFLRAGLGACALLAFPATSASIIPQRAEKRIDMLNLHTGESVKAVYWAKGRYIPDALQSIEKVLRDHRSGEQHAIDPRLLDLMEYLRYRMGQTKPFHIISGYRSPATNAMLSTHSSGVATKSLHMQGKAIDIRLPGVPLATLKKAAISLNAGGVGYYPRSDFIHLDTGAPRYW